MYSSKTITALCNLDSTKIKEMCSQQQIESSNNISFNSFLKNEQQHKQRLPQKHPCITRSHNISPSVGSYNVSYQALDTHRFAVLINSPKHTKEIIINSPRTTRNQPTNSYKKLPIQKGISDFEKQVSREQMYITKGWYKVDPSLRPAKKTMEEKLRQLEIGYEALIKFPQIEVKENPHLIIKLSHLPYDNDKMKQISGQFLSKYHIKQSTLRYFSP